MHIWKYFSFLDSANASELNCITRQRGDRKWGEKERWRWHATKIPSWTQTQFVLNPMDAHHLLSEYEWTIKGFHLHLWRLTVPSCPFTWTRVLQLIFVSIHMRPHTAFSSSCVSLSDHDCLWLDYIAVLIVSESGRMLPTSPPCVYLSAHITMAV